jgi:hypothetical protein
MKTRSGLRLALFLLLVPQSFAATGLTGFPFTDESLRYTINWPTGVSLGEAHLRARNASPGWSFEMTLEGGIPGFELKDKYSSHTNADFCSDEFARQFVHGRRKGGETETVDRSHGTVSRATMNGGGKSEFSLPDCTKDALSLLFYARRELGQGRVPPAQQILFGGLYQATLTYTGAETIQAAGKPALTDKIVCDLKGPSSSLQFEIWFARDAARTPLLFRVPFSLGRFSMELVR